LGAFLPSVSAFDAAAFGVSPPEAALMDPQQRLLLEAAAQLLQSATSIPGLLLGPNLGVYIGVAASDYGSLVKAATRPGAFHATANAPSVAAGRLAFAFGLRGPTISVDTACSASLVALHLARAALLLGEGAGGGQLAGAVVGGVHVQAAPTGTVYVSAASMLSPAGRCCVLDAAADGYVRGEACHALLLQPLASAGGRSGGRAPLAVVLGSAVNQDGRSSGLTAPNGPAQQEVVRSALAAAGVVAGGMQVLSMHGTGTALGDPIEVNAAATTLLADTTSSSSPTQPLALLASKSWHGHAEPGAGLLALHHATSAAAAAVRHPILHLRTLNPYVAGVLDSVRGAGGGRRGVSAGRQAAPLPLAAGCGSSVAGTSSFAFMVSVVDCLRGSRHEPNGKSPYMNETLHLIILALNSAQGTNAHVITSTPPQLVAGTMTNSPLPWHRTRHWALPPAHLLASRAECLISSDGGGKLTFECSLSAPQLSYLWDHVVGGSAVFPGAGYLEMASAAARLAAGSSSGNSGDVTLSGLTIRAPLLLPPRAAAAAVAEGAGEQLPLLLSCAVGLEDGALTISSRSAAGGSVVHVLGSATPALSNAAAAPPAAPLLAARAVRLLHSGGGAAAPTAKPASLAPGSTAVATVAAPALPRNDGCSIDLGAFDSFLQLGQVFILAGSQTGGAAAYVPAAVDAVTIGSSGTYGSPGTSQSADSMTAVAAPRAAAIKQHQAAPVVSDFRLLASRAADCQSLCSISGMAAKPMVIQQSSVGQNAAAPAEQPVSDLMYQVEWLVDGPLDGQQADAADSDVCSLRLRSHAAAEEQTAAALAVAKGALLPSAATGGQALAGSLQLNSGGISDPAAVCAGGVMRTVARELPAAGLSVAAADRFAVTSSPSVTLSVPPPARQQHTINVFGGRSCGAAAAVPRLLPSVAARPSWPFQLQPLPRGSLESLVPVARDVEAPRGQCLVAVKAVGVNFRDVLNVSGGVEFFGCWI
jgi:acyl transferase domain-containing protein